MFALGKRLIKSNYIFSYHTEIERKFEVNLNILDYCLLKCNSKLTQKHEDTYFDDAIYSLTKKDMWLRMRNKTLELKWPANDVLNQSDIHSGTDFYHESTDFETITNEIRKSASISLFNESKYYDRLQFAGIEAFGTIITDRTRLSLTIPITLYDQSLMKQNKSMITFDQNVFVDIDEVTFIDYENNTSIKNETNFNNRYKYTIGEIEFESMLKNDDGEVYSHEVQEKAMLQVFEIIGIDIKPIRGKVLEYLFRFKPDHYNALMACGQLKSKGL
eukprot:gene10426-14006_t